MSDTDTADVTAPSWLTDIEFCHIDDGTETRALCGAQDHLPITCADYNGEAICPTCGSPTCPQCAVLSDLEDRLVEDE